MCGISIYKDEMLVIDDKMSVVPGLSKAYDLDDYEVERVPMVIYNSTIKSEVVEKYSSYINLTPTLANLFNLDYDPRYYMGTDVFSDDYLNMVKRICSIDLSEVTSSLYMDKNQIFGYKSPLIPG